MLIQRAYKTELDLNQAQRTLCLRSAGVARKAYNWGLARKKEYYEATGKSLSLYDLKREWNARKDEEFPYVREVSTYCMQSAMADLERAFQNFFRRLKNSEKPGYPRFKSRARGIGGFRLYGSLRVREDAIQLPTFGWVRLKERGYSPVKGVKILCATVSERAGRWYVSLQVEQEISDVEPLPGACGVDVGIKSLAVLSDGTVYMNPKATARYERKLKRLQRALSRKQKGSTNRKKAKVKVAKLQARIASVRRDATHQATADITRRFGTVAVEDLNVAGMIKNHKLAKAVSDAGFSEFRRQLAYKLAWRNGTLVVANRFFPSSKTCSVCGSIKAELKLSERVFRCEVCEHTQDRDLNAARNLAGLTSFATTHTHSSALPAPTAPPRLALQSV